jgi:hypothetical protein
MNSKLNIAYKFRLFAEQSTEKVDYVCRNVVEDVGCDEVIPLVTDKADTRIPHDITAWVFHPCFECNCSEISPGQWVMVTR